MKLVSGCLCGIHCRHDGGTKEREEIVRLVRQGVAVPVCPEQLGGLPTPRPAAEIDGGDGHDVLAGRAQVLTRDGLDVTEEFVRGAHEVLRLAREMNADEVILKSRSPSCGVDVIVRDGEAAAGDGVTAALLRREGIRVRCID